MGMALAGAPCQSEPDTGAPEAQIRECEREAMSTPLNVAIFARLSGAESLTGDAATAQSDLATLLTTDPDSGMPIEGRVAADGIYQGNKNDAPDGYPMVTFRPSPGGIDERFETGFVVDKPLLDLEIWDNSHSGTLATDIEDAIDRLLDRRRRAPELPLSAGRCFYLKTFVTSGAIYDSQLKAWCLMKRYIAVEGK